MELFLNTAQNFAVPSAVADHFLGLATHDQLKVLLYILRHSDEHLTDTQIAAACKVRVEAVEEAVVFWQNVNLLQNSVSASVSCSVDAQKSETTQVVPKQEEPAVAVPEKAAKVQSSSAQFSLMPSEIAQHTKENPQMAEMLNALEHIVAHPLTHTELRSVFWMHEYLGLAPDLILMLAAFCIEIDCYNIRYIEEIAVEWQERGIMTHELADADITRRTFSRTYTGKIMKLFEMTRRPTPKQQAFIDVWQAEGYAFDLIELAYHITREAKDDKLNFSYINGILKRWSEAGIKTTAEAIAHDAAFHESKKRPPEKQSPAQKEYSFEVSDLEKMMNRF